MEKKILIFVNSLRIGGGSEKIAAEIGSNLKQKGYNVIFLARYDANQKYEYDGEYLYLYKTRKKNIISKTFRELRTIKRITKICKKEDVKTIISFCGLPNICAILSKKIYQNKAKIIVTVHNNPLRIVNCFDRYLIKKLYPFSDKIISVSKHLEIILKTKFFLKNVQTIYNIQDIKEFRKLSRKKIEDSYNYIFDDEFIYITIGSLTYQKGQWHLIRSFKRVCEIKKNCKLVIIGNGVLENKLKTLVEKLAIKKKVFFINKVDTVFPYLKMSDCFVFSSLFEGFGLVITEALSQNLSIISTDCKSGPREILCPEIEIEKNIEYPYYGKYGILSKPFDDNISFNTLKEKPLSKEEIIFSEVMVKVYENVELRKKYSNGIKRAEDFDIDKILAQWEKII